MKAYALKIWQNPLFGLLMQGVMAQTVLLILVIGMVEVPPDAILDSSLRDVISIFED